MSTTTLQISIRVNGTLTDPDGSAVSVSNVVRTDTGAVVLAGPASMTRQSAGVYAYALTDPLGAVALTYTWNAGFARNGVPQSPQLTTRQALSIATPAGRYASLQDWDNFAGSINVLAYSDKGGAGVLNAAGIQAAMDYADEQIDLALGTVYATPLTPVTPQVRFWATVIGVGRFEYFGRGQSDTDKAGDRFAKLVNQACREMRAALGPMGRLPCALRAGVSFGVSNAGVRQAHRIGSPYDRGPGWCW